MVRLPSQIYAWMTAYSLLAAATVECGSLCPAHLLHKVGLAGEGAQDATHEQVAEHEAPGGLLIRRQQIACMAGQRHSDTHSSASSLLM